MREIKICENKNQCGDYVVVLETMDWNAVLFVVVEVI